MLASANFLCELGTEEIPAGYIPPAIDGIKRIFSVTFRENRVDFNDIQVFATPRRIAVMVSGLAASQKDETAEIKGPAVKAAYGPGGEPTKALNGFLKGNGLSIDNIFQQETDKGEYIFARKKLDVRPTIDIIPDIIKEIVNNLPFPKRMRWSDKKITFPRPLRYFLILFNDDIIEFEIDGIQSSNRTRGHYIQHNEMVEIGTIADYESVLEENSVIVDHKKRKERIRAGLIKASEDAGGRLNEDEELLDTVTFLVENPAVVACEFNPAYLEIPDIALIAVMKKHQKYFSVMDNNGRLTSTFLVVSNNPETPFVRAGNERVVTARFNDAGFFYDEDRKHTLAERVHSLKKVLFHKELGSIYDKVLRMKDAADIIAGCLELDDKTKGLIDRAVLLCKADLETSMVYEFGSLQGGIGRIYALNDGEPPEVAAAIEEHYNPRYQGDILPAGMVSVVVSISEKIDNIMGSFSVGNVPRGSQDPYALRRQANAIVDIIIKNELNLDLKKVFVGIAKNYRDGSGLVDKIMEFVSARAKTIFSESGFSHDEIDACLSVGSHDFLELYRRARSINEFRKDERFTEMLLGFKRMNNIVTAFRRDNGDYALAFSEGLLETDEEKNLYRFFHDRKAAIEENIASSRYIELFRLIIDGKSLIDNFFDRVLVMEKNTGLRDNRLYLLEDILKNFTGLLDFSRISDK